MKEKGGKSPSPSQQDLLQPLTCCSQANVDAVPLEFTAALGLWHNELTALMQVGDDSGEVVITAATEQKSTKLRKSYLPPRN